MKDHIIEISDLVKHGLNNYTNHNNQLIISSVRDLYLFEYPCRLRAITFLICEEGFLEGTVNMKKFKLQNGYAMVNFSENIIQITKTVELKAYAIIISPEYLQQIPTDYFPKVQYLSLEVGENEKIKLSDLEMRMICGYINILGCTISSNYSKKSERIIQRHLIPAFVESLMIIRSNNQNKGLADEELNSHGKIAIRNQFFKLLELHHTHERELIFYARKMCITPKYLSMVIKNTTGRKATDWIRDIVILEAKSLLIYSGKSIKEISNQLNFPTQSSFGKYFKSQVGLSPKDYY